MTKIPHDKIEEVRDLTDIVDVVSDYVRLKKRGSNFVGLCPFHAEKTPSFNVNPAMGIYKCFGCGVGGDIFSFVSEVESLSFPEVVRLLADRAGVTIPEQDEIDEEASETEAIYHALRFAARHFFQNLTQTDHGAEARDYLKNRGLTADTVKHFGLGYGINAWDDLLEATERSRMNPHIVEKSGLIIKRKERDGYYDRYRNRVIFPILSHVGKVLGFGARVIDPKDEPKYINSPETPVYTKSRVLYGLYQARQEIRAREEAVLVEGYTDVISLHQAGFTHAVATCGTALTPEQIHLISRYARRILLLYDADSAGVRAAFRAIDLILEKGLAAYAVALPEGEDPDSFVKRIGRTEFDAYLKDRRQDFVHFILTHAGRTGRMDTPEGQADVQRTILRSISRIPDPLVQESYLKLASDALDIPDMQLRKVLKGIGRGTRRNPRYEKTAAERPAAAIKIEKKRESLKINDRVEPLPEEKALLRLMLGKGLPLVEFILGHMALSEFSAGPGREMAEHLVSMYESGKIDRQAFIRGDLGDDLRRMAAELLTSDVEPSANWEIRRNIPVPKLDEDAVESAASAMMLLKLDRVDSAIGELKDEIFKVDRAGDDVRGLQKKMIDLHTLRRTIEERKFISDV